ncbi:hypothetical protein ACTA71_006940 [Dictyostelium dimigraforme]
MVKHMKVAIIVTDEVLECKNKGEFYSLYDNFIKRYGLNDEHNEFGNIEVITSRYSAVQKEWPTDPLSYDGYIITGSASSAYDSNEWIVLLKERIIELDKHEMKMCGICFGHQILVETLGGKIEKNIKGWELGQHTVSLHKDVSVIFDNIINNKNKNKFNNDSANSSRSNSPILKLDGASSSYSSSSSSSPLSSFFPSTQSLKETISIYQIHQDHISILPKDMIPIGITEKSIQGVLKESKKQPGNFYIISFQGHPEFSYDFIHLLISDLQHVDQEMKNISIKTLQQTTCQPWLSNLVFNFFKN